MYNFSHYKEKDQSKILQFIHEHPFAFLTGSNSDGLQVATQLPMLLEERDGKQYLQGHIMRKTDHHKAFLENPKALLVFTGAHSYVSATWYSDPHVGSTWNYMSVHVHSEIRWMDDDELSAFMKKLTLHFEQGNNQSPTYFDNLPKEYIDRMMPAIIGIELKLDQIDNVFKLSQNRDHNSYQNIISHLKKQGDAPSRVAQAMEDRSDELFHR